MKTGIIVILIIIIFILASVLMTYRRQIEKICRQLSFLEKHDSNMMVTTDMRMGGLGALTDVLNARLDAQRKAQQKADARERLISDTYTNLSHDIRTPLTSLDGYFQLLKESISLEEKERYINIIQERIGSLKEMLEEMFTFTKLRDDSFALTLEPVDSCRLLTELILSYYDEWLNRGIQPEIHIPETPVMITAHPLALKRTIQNVIKNGMDHGEKEIRIELKQDKTEAVLTISNHAAHPEDIDTDRVFDRFYKADQARSKTSSGLGLSIAREFVQHMDGNIRAELHGSTFSVIITMPLYQK